MDIYNAAGFVAFGAIELVLYRKLPVWVARSGGPIRSWRWLAFAKLMAGVALLVGLRHSSDIGWLQLLLFWLGGGLAATGLQAINYSRVRNVDWPDVLVPTFLLGSFFSALGCLGVKATLAPDLLTIGSAAAQVALAALCNLIVAILLAIISWDPTKRPASP